MRVQSFSTLLALIFTAPAFAGDPCPIDFQVHDLGAPEWLDRDALLDALQSKDSWVGMSFSTKQGKVVVKAVSTRSPAAMAGLTVGDIITKAGGTPVVTHQALAAILRAAKPGSKLRLDVTRPAGAATITLTLGRQDPVVGALTDLLSAKDCTSVRKADLSAAEAKRRRARVFTAQRRFRCDDAHLSLAQAVGTEEGLSAGDIVVVRGSKRLLISNPGQATTCVYAKTLDGAKLTPANLQPIFDAVAKPYIDDRHANP